MIRNKLSVENIRKAFLNPRLALKYAGQIVQREIFSRKYPDSTDIMEADWDTLLLLDSCRYDVFEEVNDIEGTLSRIVSPASHSREFRKKVFEGKQFHDTIYVTANVYCAQVPDGTFYKMYTTLGKDSGTDDVTKAHSQANVDPERLTELAIKANGQHPDKRLIVHYMQPHEPYLGSRAKEAREKLKQEGYHFAAWEPELSGNTDDKMVTRDLMSLAMDSSVTEFDSEDLRVVYRENLELVLGYVKRLINELDGKTVITADHGELLGSSSGWFIRDRFHHREEVYVPQLRFVPWLEVEGESRRHIRAESPIESETVDEEETEEMLRIMGYLD